MKKRPISLVNLIYIQMVYMYKGPFVRIAKNRIVKSNIGKQ